MESRITGVTEYSAIPNIQSSGLPPDAAPPKLGGMAKLGPHRGLQKSPPKQRGTHFLKEWRIYRDLTVDQLSEMTNLSTGTISGTENRRQGYSPESLEALARALKTTPGSLLEVNPLADGAESFWRLWDKASPKDRETLKIMAERLVEPPKGRK
jgi:transcriptional regulator with XRE-family HTH domain